MKNRGNKRGKRVHRYFFYLRNYMRSVLQGIRSAHGEGAQRAGGEITTAVGGANGRITGQDAPRGTDKSRIILSWPDRYYLVGTPELYNTIREAFRSQGLEYEGTYFRTAADNGQRVFSDLKTG